MPRIEPAFIDLAPAAGGRCRFAVLHRPDGPVRGLVVYAHPWAEEMNKSRRMAALQARALAAAGHAVLQIDLLGCGDSPGDFGAATWDEWVQDMVAAARWLRRLAEPPAAATAAVSGSPHAPLQDTTADPPLTLWGLRAGALLAAAAAQQLGDVQRLLLWQPPAAGRSLLQQFLRLAVAGEALAGGAGPGDDTPPEAAPAAASPPRRGGTEALKQRLQAGEPVEIAGYSLAPALAMGLEAARLSPPPAAPQVLWLECSPREAPALLPATAAPLAAWRAAGCHVQAQAVQGPAFWQTTEIEDAPALVEAGTAWLRGLDDGAAAHPAPLSGATVTA